MNPVKKEDKDPELGDKLWDERNIIVSYLFTFVEKLEKLNYEFPPIPEDISKGYSLKSKEDYLQNFIDERCEIGTTEDFCLVSDMRKEFKNYQFYNPGPHCTPTEFNNFMESHGVYRVRTSGARGFSGIRIRERKRNLLDSAIDHKML